MNQATISQALLSQLALPEGITIRAFIESDFPWLQKLYEKEGWMTLVNRPGDGLMAWSHSSIACIALHDDRIIGCIRAISDGSISTYIAELLVDTQYRGKGIGTKLIQLCHLCYPGTRLDLLSSETSIAFYDQAGFRSFSGYRKNFFGK